MSERRFQWGTKQPGFLVILIDQSGSMSTRNHHIEVAKAVQDAVFECFSRCISGADVKDRFSMSLIGYGDSSAQEIWSGHIDDEELGKELYEAHNRNTSFFPAKASGGTPMTEALELAYKLIQQRNADLEDQKNKEEINGISAPIVINITDGMPNDESTATAAAQKLMDIKCEDGNVILFNMHISARGAKELLFPATEADLDGSPEARFLFNISSPLDDDMVNNAYANGFESVKAGVRGMITNASGKTIPRFIQFGSSMSLMK